MTALLPPSTEPEDPSLRPDIDICESGTFQPRFECARVDGDERVAIVAISSRGSTGYRCRRRYRQAGALGTLLIEVDF
jgi:hypothetical protein